MSLRPTKLAGSLAALLALMPASAPVFGEMSVTDLQEAASQFTPADEFGRYVYMVRFAEAGLLDQHRAMRGSAAGYDAQSDLMRAARSELQATQRERLDQIQGVIGRQASVSHHFLDTHSGVAIRLSPAEADKLLTVPGVALVERERMYSLGTYRTPEFIGADTVWDGSNVPGGAELTGELMIAAILDSGIVPNHPSFTNSAVCGHGEGEVPNKLLGAVDCAASDSAGRCSGPNPLDVNGHGTHVAGTAIGNFVGTDAVPAPDFPVAGIAPCAHVRSYKVCPGASCPGADLTAGLNTLLQDGNAAVMNYSISGGSNPWVDFDRSKLDLVEAGIFVAAAAGNTSATITNPIGTVNHRGPWVMAVANTTHDRASSNQVTFDLAGPSVFGLKGAMTIPADVSGQIADALALGDELGCTPFAAESMSGRIALISRGNCPFADKLTNAANAGAVGAIIYNNVDGQPPIAMGGTEASIPAVMTFFSAAASIRTHVAANAGTIATIDSETVNNTDPSFGDILAASSLRGPTPAPLRDLQKPNIAAPGSSIYAADASPTSEPRYGFKSGTSMASPHVAGAAVLMRQRHPTWTPMEVMTALQMTAKKSGFKDFAGTPPRTGPWDADDVGHGRVDLTKALRAGLVMHETTANFLAANPATGGDVRTLNQPALRNLDCSPTCTFTRTVRNTLSTPSSWTVTNALNTGDFNIQISPTSFSFTGDTGETQTVTVTISPIGTQNAITHFGEINFTEAAQQSPGLHWTLALRGLELGLAQLQYTPDALSAVVVEGGTRTLPVTITNANATGEALTFSFAEAPASRSVLLDINARQSEELSGGPSEPVSLQIDGGISSIIGVGTQQILWFNRFSPRLLDLPFTLQTVQVGLAPGNGNVEVGDLFDVYVWTDADRDPSNGATLIASVTGQVITTGVGFKTVALPADLRIEAADGDVLVGVVNRSARIVTGTSYGVVIGDAAGNSAQRSWIGFNFPGGNAANPPVFADAASFGLIDGLAPGRNWTIRATGVGGTNCLAPSDVPWLSVAPATGSVAGGESTTVEVQLNAAGLAPGQYEALLCLTSNDPTQPLAVVPVSMQVATDAQLPKIAVQPGSLSMSALAGAVATDDLGISNTGSLIALNWQIAEAEANPAGGSSNIVRFDDLNFSFPPDIAGGAVQWGNGETCVGAPCENPPWDFNPYAVPNLAFYWPNVVGASQIGGGVLEGTDYAVLQPGANVGPASTFSAAAASARTIRWRQAGGVDGYLGFRFVNPTTSQVNYGYAHIRTTGTTGYPATMVSFAYDNSGAPIAIPFPPACESPSDIAWLSAAPASGTTAAGETSTSVISADSTGLAIGTYRAVLCVTSNDDSNPVVEVPVTFDVNPLPPEIFANGFESSP